MISNKDALKEAFLVSATFVFGFYGYYMVATYTMLYYLIYLFIGSIIIFTLQRWLR
jgi:hypothetical protein